MTSASTPARFVSLRSLNDQHPRFVSLRSLNEQHRLPAFPVVERGAQRRDETHPARRHGAAA